MKAAYAEAYRSLHEQHWWFRARRRVLLRELRRLCPPSGFGPILDIGAGDGLFLEDLEAFGEPEGLEPAEEVVSAATRRRWTMHLQPFDEGFAPDRSYGLIVMFDVLEHLDDAPGVVRKAFSLLRRDGRFLITVPAFETLWTHHDDVNHHRERYRLPELRRLLEDEGFRVSEGWYLFHWLVPLKLMVRWKERWLGVSTDVPTVPPPLWNALFDGLCRLEEATWGRLPIPVGTSIFVAAIRD